MTAMTSIVVHAWPDHSKSLGSGPAQITNLLNQATLLCSTKIAKNVVTEAKAQLQDCHKHYYDRYAKS